jgi:hypothetical protein
MSAENPLDQPRERTLADLYEEEPTPTETKEAKGVPARETVAETVEERGNRERATAERVVEVKERLGAHERAPKQESDWERGQREKREKDAAVGELQSAHSAQNRQIEQKDEKAKRLVNWSALGTFTTGAAITAGTMIASTTSLGVASEATILAGTTVFAPWVAPALAAGVGVALVGGGAVFLGGHAIRAFNKWRKKQASEAEYKRGLSRIERGVK